MESLIERRSTREVKVGNIGIGGDNPIRVQTMITEETRNVSAAVWQIYDLYGAGAEIVRVTVQTKEQVDSIREIRSRITGLGLAIPLVADVHHQASSLAVSTVPFVDKVRINPGLFVDRGRQEKIKDYSPLDIEERLEQIEAKLAPVLNACKEFGVALRLGVNHGSLSNRILTIYGNTPQGMVESVMEYLKICERYNFKDIVISLKASDAPLMVQANRLMVQRMDHEQMDYPLHLGVTEAGNSQAARIKSAVGIGALLLDGIGDTIRVSLTEDSENELSVCYDILQSTHRRITQTEYKACPSCGRTQFDIEEVFGKVKARTTNIPGLIIAVMGCGVNGFGEAANADYALVGGAPGKVLLIERNQVIATVDADGADKKLAELIEQRYKLHKFS